MVDRIVDFHNHWLPKEIFKQLGGEEGGKKTYYLLLPGGFRIPGLTLWDYLCDVDDRLRTLDSAGIDKAVLSFPFTSILSTLERCRLFNNKLAQLIKEHPEKFIGLASIPPLKGIAAIEELERAVSLGLRGLLLPSSFLEEEKNVFLDSEKLWPLYEKVVDLDVPILIHGRSVPPGYQWMDFFDISRGIGREFDLALAVIRMIAAGILERFPKLKIVVSHMGGATASVKGEMKILTLPERTVPEWPYELPKPFEEYFDMLYFDTAGSASKGLLTPLRCAMLNIKKERLIFGLDFPQEVKTPEEVNRLVEDVRSLIADERDRRSIFFSTAAKILGI